MVKLVLSLPSSGRRVCARGPTALVKCADRKIKLVCMFWWWGRPGYPEETHSSMGKVCTGRQACATMLSSITYSLILKRPPCCSRLTFMCTFKCAHCLLLYGITGLSFHSKPVADNINVSVLCCMWCIPQMCSVITDQHHLSLEHTVQCSQVFNDT